MNHIRGLFQRSIAESAAPLHLGYVALFRPASVGDAGSTAQEVEEIPAKKNIDVHCICGSALLLITPAVPLAQSTPPGVRAISRSSAQMGSCRDPGEQNPQRVRRLSFIHFFFLNTVEGTVIKAEITHRSRTQGIWSTAVDCDVSTSKHRRTNLRNTPCPNLHLLVTF